MASPDAGPPVETDGGNTGHLFEDASGDDASCVGTSFAATKPRLDLFVMLDQSSSMNEIAGDTTRWDAVASALSTFIQRPETAGIGFGLQYFGLPQHSADGGTCEATPCTNDAECGPCGPCNSFLGTCGGDFEAPSCWVPDYAKAEIEIQPLPDVAPAVMASLRDHSFPWTRTPTSAALEGAIRHATDWAKLPANADHVTAVLFATDGTPSDCDRDPVHIRQIAVSGATNTPKILTFVVGVGPDLASLNDIADGGGTGQAYLVDSNAAATQNLLDSLNDVRVRAVGCVYAIPTQNGAKPNFTEVNVRYTPGDGSPAETFPKVADQASCPADGDAWYYDDNTSPTKIFLCSSTCSKFTAGASPKIDVILGCETRLK